MSTTPKTEIVRARVDEAVKHDAEKTLAAMGMNMSDAIRIFLHQLVIRHEFPVELKVPNETTIKAMHEKPKGHFQSVDELFDDAKE
ncbi:MAG: type II toxin-antitoxin system RelB/DinJ family antitoxin [Pseudomonadota bacterium]